MNTPGAIDMRAVREAVLAAIGPVSADCLAIIEAAFGDAPAPSIKVLAARLAVHPSSLLSRFFRAGLPSPKTLMRRAALYRIAVLRARGWSFCRISYELDFSSPQALTRFVIQETGCRSVPYFAAHDAEAVLAGICNELGEHRERWAGFQPIPRAVAA